MIIVTEYCSIDLDDPNNLQFENEYFEKIYITLFNLIDPQNCYPQIDFDKFRDLSIGFNIRDLAKSVGFKEKTKEKDNYQKALFPFIEKYPVFYNFIQNLSVATKPTIISAEIVMGEGTNSSNFIAIKRVIDQWNQRRWTRTKEISESQSGVSVLGSVSEGLLQTALESFINEKDFFKNNTSAVQSYGDFVLMCLPNNLWLSVKSNFARERLLASGFTTDILGVGFFTDPSEFTSGAKIRNFQKVGFLAMYVPDIPITDEQIEKDLSTYQGIIDFYDSEDRLPVNVNGKPFVRKLSSLHDDLSTLLAEEDIKKRVTIGF